MNHTKNYNLPQWELNDIIRMEDFNGAMNNLESGMTSTAAAAADAQKTAETARKTAVAAFGPSNMPYTVGSYTGNGAADREFDLGFHPSFLLICYSQLTYTLNNVGQGVVMAGPGVTSGHIYLTEKGFRFGYHDPVNIYPEVNKNGELYNYIAFR